MYRINSAAVSVSEMAKLKGQAKIVMDELLRDETPRFASQINTETEKCLKTRQDTLRVTLYYIIVFKSKGWIHTTDSDTPSEEITQCESSEVTE